MSENRSQILIIQNISREGPGLIGEILDQQQIKYDLIDLEKGDILPVPSGYRAMIILGGPDSVNDKTVKIAMESETIQVALKQRIPFLGVCLGLQLLVKTGGGDVLPNPVKEIGVRDPEGSHFEVSLTPEGKQDRLFRGLPETFPVFQLHGETVLMRFQMQLLARGKHCEHQAVKVGQNAYGLQFHLEMTPAMLETWLAEDVDLQTVDKDAMRRYFAEIVPTYHRIGRQLIENFLQIAGFKLRVVQSAVHSQTTPTQPPRQ